MIKLGMDEEAKALVVELRKNMWNNSYDDSFKYEPAMLHYLRSCRAFHRRTRSRLMYMRVVGMFTSGFISRPECEYSRQLTLHFVDGDDAPIPHKEELGAAWVRLVFGNWADYVWEDRANLMTFDLNKKPTVHYRVFTDKAHRSVRVLGEAATAKLTERGWVRWASTHIH